MLPSPWWTMARDALRALATMAAFVVLALVGYYALPAVGCTGDPEATIAVGPPLCIEACDDGREYHYTMPEEGCFLASRCVDDAPEQVAM